MSRPARGEEGFALVAALWLTAVVGVVLLALLDAARAERRAVLHGRAAAESRWAARAATSRLVRELDVRLRAGPALDLSRGDTILGPVVVGAGRATGRAVLRDPRARLHLPTADRRSLLSLLRSAGVTGGEASGAADRLEAWVARVTRPAPPGTSSVDTAAGAPPDLLPGAALEDAVAVAGVSGIAAAGLEAWLTLEGDGRLNVNAAPAPVLATLPGLGPDGVQALVRGRRTSPYRSLRDVLARLPRSTREEVRRAWMEAWIGRIAFRPGGAVLEAEGGSPGGGPGARVRVSVDLPGGSSWAVRRIDEPY